MRRLSSHIVKQPVKVFVPPGKVPLLLQPDGSLLVGHRINHQKSGCNIKVRETSSTISSRQSMIGARNLLTGNMSEDLQAVIKRVMAGSRDKADLQLIAAALHAGQVVLATGDHSVAIGGNGSNSVMVTGDNNQVILLTEEAAIALERILQQWQPKQGQYVQPKGCQKRQECDRYLEVVLQRLERLGSPEILRDEVYKRRRFNYIARMVDFEPGLGMRREAFFLFSELLLST